MIEMFLTVLAWMVLNGESRCDNPCGFGGICDGKDNQCEFFSNGYHCNLGEGAPCPDHVNCWQITGKTYYTSKTCSDFDGPKVVGYLPSWHVDYLDLEAIDWSTLTHIMIHGAADWPTFEVNDHARAIQKVAKEHGVITYISFPGSNEAFVAPSTAPATAKAMVAAVLDLGADGMDVDLEGAAVENDFYNPFMKLLWKEAREAGLGFSAAIGYGEVRDGSQIDALELLDFLNIMIYDKGFGETEPHQHSPYDWYVEIAEYFLNHLQIPGRRVNLGIPFYGNEFLNGGIKGRMWSEFLNTYPSAMHEDSYEDVAYYNGLDTVHDKAMYALQRGAGVMIWEIGQDTFKEQRQFSLLRQIKTVFDGCDNACPHGGECESKAGKCVLYSTGYHCNLGALPCPSGVHCWHIGSNNYYTSTKCADVEPCLDACAAGGACMTDDDSRYCAVYDNGYACDMGNEACPAGTSCWTLHGRPHYTSLYCAKFDVTACTDHGGGHCPTGETCMCHDDCIGNWGRGDKNRDDGYCSGGGARMPGTVCTDHGGGSCSPRETCMCHDDCIGNWGPGDKNPNDAYCSGGGARIHDSSLGAPNPVPISGEGSNSDTYAQKDDVSCSKRKIKVERKGVMKSYRTFNFEKAKAKCDELGEECAGVMDNGCDGKGKYTLCKKSDKPLRTKPGSCVHMKDL